jgi:hypothetical protein
MTKKLEELLNLDKAQRPYDDDDITVDIPVNKDIKKKAKLVIPEIVEDNPAYKNMAAINSQVSALESMSRELPSIKELDNFDETEVDKLAIKAERAYEDLMDLGMNVEIRYASRIFEIASSMLGHAVDARSSKLERRLKAINIQMQKYKVEYVAPPIEPPQPVINGQGYVVTDRNELLKKLIEKEE